MNHTNTHTTWILTHSNDTIIKSELLQKKKKNQQLAYAEQ